MLPILIFSELWIELSWNLISSFDPNAHDGNPCGFRRSASVSRCFLYLGRKAIAEAVDRGTWSAECDLATWVVVVSMLGVEVRDSSSAPVACCHSMTSGSLMLEVISYDILR